MWRRVAFLSFLCGVFLVPSVSAFSVKSASGFDQIAGCAANTIVCSDQKRDETGFDGASTGWTSWVDEKSATQLQDTVDQIELRENHEWIRWINDCPSPVTFDLTAQLRSAAHKAMGSNETDRLGLRLIYLPSGDALQQPLQTAPGGMIYGKLLKGGVTRFRLIGDQRRRAGERTVISSEADRAWMQYGGPERSYQALDIGGCILLELILLPAGLTLPLLNETSNCGMVISSIPWDPHELLWLERDADSNFAKQEKSPPHKSIKNGHSGEFSTGFEMSVGGLQPQIDEIVRRVLEFRGLQDDHKQDAKTLVELGLHPVRGLLLYGAAGVGKTLLAREISGLLRTRQPPKIVAAPELLDRWVGGTEQLVRDLFADAEEELRRTSAVESSLHVIVVDEIDAVFRKRSDSDSASEVTRASAVNQILAKLDGVHSMGNVLFIGMTNRRELLDPALLRPGRLEVQIEITRPNREGRREILMIHFDKLRKRGRLSQPLCDAIDGKGYKRRRLSRWFLNKPMDLAAGRWTGGFTGADLAGLVRSAGSIALARCRKQDENGVGSLLITLPDVLGALDEIKT